MNRNISLFRLLAALLVSFALFAACSGHDDIIDQVPEPISKFVAQYFPGYGYGQYEHTATGYHVRLKNGPGMNFDNTYIWESVDGYGLPLPQVFLFDQTPPKLYGYLQASSSLNEVFNIQRNTESYTVTLLNSTLVYDISTEDITTAQ